MKKIKRSSKIIERVLSVLFWIIAVCAVIAVVAFTIILAKGESVPVGTSTSIVLGNYRVTLADAANFQIQPIALITIINVALAAIFSCYAIRVLQQIFRSMSQGLPFSGSVSKSIRKIAWVQLVYGIIGVVLQIITNVIFYKSLDIASLFNPEIVISCELATVSDGNFLIWFVILLLLSHIFQYGEQLQQFSDETL